MTRLFRSTLIATLIAFHAAVTVCATGLHALPGLSHDSGLRPFAKDDHSHGPGKGGHSASDECPVCQFLAQGQLSTDVTAAATGWLVIDRASTWPENVRACSLLLHSAPRAPPLRIVG